MAISDRIAIMDGGRIAQIGTAEELYQRPTSRFVAGFLGNANLIRGVVVAADGQRTTIDVSGFRWEIDLTRRCRWGNAWTRSFVRKHRIWRRRNWS